MTPTIRLVVLGVFVFFALLNLGEAATFTIYEAPNFNRTSTITVARGETFKVRIQETTAEYPYHEKITVPSTELTYTRGNQVGGFRDFTMTAHKTNDQISRIVVNFEMKDYPDYKKVLTIEVIDAWVTHINLDAPDNTYPLYMKVRQGQPLTVSVVAPENPYPEDGPEALCAWKGGNDLTDERQPKDVIVKGVLNEWFDQAPRVPNEELTNFTALATLTPMGIGMRYLTFKCWKWHAKTNRLVPADRKYFTLSSVQAG